MSGVTLRKVARCRQCDKEIAKGSHAYRPLLYKEISGVLRMHRICDACAEVYGTEKKYV